MNLSSRITATLNAIVKFTNTLSDINVLSPFVKMKPYPSKSVMTFEDLTVKDSDLNFFSDPKLNI